MDRPERKPARLSGYDYSAPGHYFITVCALDHRHLFWEHTPDLAVGADIIRPAPYVLSKVGLIVEQTLLDMPNHYPNVKLGPYVIMPNHIHMIIELTATGRMISAPTKSIPTIVGQFKRAASKHAGRPLWQKGYHDHIIRNEADYRRIWQYIDTNPAKWREDCYHEDGVY